MSESQLTAGTVSSIDADQFATAVLESELPVLVDFSATWCGPCRMLEPVVEGLAAELSGRARVVKIDIEKNPQLAASYGVTAVPTLLFFKAGQVVDQAIGLLPGPQLKGKLEALI